MSKKLQTGFSLVEILISVLVVSFGLLSLAGLQMTSVKGVNNAHSENVASMLTMELSERMRANPKQSRTVATESRLTVRLKLNTVVELKFALLKKRLSLIFKR